MNVSSINTNDRRNLFISYSNSFMSLGMNNNEISGIAPKTESDDKKKLDKVKGIETLTIFPKQVIDGRTIITA